MTDLDYLAVALFIGFVCLVGASVQSLFGG